MSTRRAMLRAATQAQHQALDAQLARLDFADVAGYRSFLEASAAALVPLEMLLAASGVASELPDWAERRRAELICEDVRTLGGMIVPLHLQTTRLSLAEMFGVLYVLEGSRLGAQLLLQRVPAHVRATRYLAAGPRTLWPTFLARLETMTLETASAATAAVHTFGVFQRAFARCAHREPLALQVQ